MFWKVLLCDYFKGGVVVEFRAKAVIKERGSFGWTSREVVIDSIESIRNIFAPEQEGVEQVNLSLNSKVYYAMRLLKDGIDGKVVDGDGDTHYLVSPILLVECDNEKPIDISENMLKEMEDAIILF